MTLTLQASGLEQLQLWPLDVSLSSPWRGIPSHLQRNKVVTFGGEVASRTMANRAAKSQSGVRGGDGKSEGGRSWGAREKVF